MHAHRLLSLAVLVAAIQDPREAAGYCLTKYGTGTSWASWPQMPIKYRISSNLKDQAIIGAIDKAFATWDAVACSNLSFKKEADFDIKTAFAGGTGFISVYWVTQASELPSGVNASWYSYHFIGYDATGKLNTMAFVLNAIPPLKWNTTGGDASTFDVQNVATHYVGLMIGLARSKTAGSVMADDIGYGQITKRTLTQDDINALAAIYQGTCPAPPAPDAACGTTPPPPPVDAGPKKDTVAPPPPPPTEAGTKRDTGSVVPPPGDRGPIGPGNELGGVGAEGLQGCTSNAECAADEICSGGKCMKPGTGGEEDDGCGCLVGGLARSLALGPMLIIALALLVLARRRRAR